MLEPLWPNELINAVVIINVLILIDDKTGREILDGKFRKKNYRQSIELEFTTRQRT
jgi:hypothetical protein